MDEQAPAHRANPADVPSSPGWTWMVSPYDEQLHCFEALGEHFAEAMCSHCAPRLKLTPDDEECSAPRCVACLLIHGDELTRRGRIGERDRWQQ